MRVNNLLVRRVLADRRQPTIPRISAADAQYDRARKPMIDKGLHIIMPFATQPKTDHRHPETNLTKICQISHQDVLIGRVDASPAASGCHAGIGESGEPDSVIDQLTQAVQRDPSTPSGAGP